MNESHSTPKTSLPLAHDSYIAVALQPRTYGCRNKKDMEKNLDNVCRLIDEAMYICPMEGPVRLFSLTEGSLQGMWDEYTDMDQFTYCKELAITVPGEETERLAEKAKQYNVYIAAQAKVVEPEIVPDRFFNMGFIISPHGEVILKHRKNAIGLIEASTTPWDVWDRYAEEVGDDLESCYPVARTEIGNLAIAICAETFFPETYRALLLNGAEVIIKMAFAEPFIMNDMWEIKTRAAAFHNISYVVAPNFGPYYTNPDVDAPYSLAGGHSMIVDYKGQVVRKVDHGNEAYVPGEINIKGLREYRAQTGVGLMMAQMRCDQWKQIYERWPAYPKNAYLDDVPDRAQGRVALHQELGKRLFEAGIYTPPENKKE